MKKIIIIPFFLNILLLNITKAFELRDIQFSPEISVGIPALTIFANKADSLFQSEKEKELKEAAKEMSASFPFSGGLIIGCELFRINSWGFEIVSGVRIAKTNTLDMKRGFELNEKFIEFPIRLNILTHFDNFFFSATGFVLGTNIRYALSSEFKITNQGEVDKWVDEHTKKNGNTQDKKWSDELKKSINFKELNSSSNTAFSIIFGGITKLFDDAFYINAVFCLPLEIFKIKEAADKFDEGTNPREDAYVQKAFRPLNSSLIRIDVGLDLMKIFFSKEENQ